MIKENYELIYGNAPTMEEVDDLLNQDYEKKQERKREKVLARKLKKFHNPKPNDVTNNYLMTKYSLAPE